MNLKFFLKHYILRKFEQRFIIPQYGYKRKTILEYSKKYNSKTFIETGTFLGDTTNYMKDFFDTLYTIELQPDLYLKAKKRFEKDEKIKVLLGDSSVVLKSLNVENNGNSLFWLDGHYSSEFILGDELIETAKGKKDTPIMEELSIILKIGLQQNVILIDDARCFNGENDYPTKKQLFSFLIQQNISQSQISIKKDIIRIVPLKNT